ncbi:MAG: hypothetical protein KAY37_13305 [Phycisphaerae bacterium]|nr:hypothetical protein [Phycisphaerae bacterium]
MTERKRLSEKSVMVLSLIADGHSYSQIVDGHAGISYLDIFAAAEEALQLSESQSDYHARMAEIKKRHPRAYEKWEAEEDERLTGLIRAGEPVMAIAQRFERQPSAIRSRLAKLNLTSANRSIEQG